MAKSFSISLKIGIIDAFTKGMAKIGQSTQKLSEKLDKAGKKMSIGISAPIVAIGFMAINTAAKFDTAMNKVSAITRATDEEFQRLEKTALKMGKETQYSAAESAEAMTYLAMAGLDVNQTIAAIPKTLQLAAAGGLELAQAADISTNIMTAMRMEISDLNHVNDVLALTQAKANTNVLELAEGMKNVAGTAALLGFGIEDVSAMLGKMADAGDKGGNAGTLLRNAMMAVVSPTNKSAEAFSSLGINLKDFTTNDGKIKNFAVLLKRLEKATPAQIFDAFGERGGRAIVALTAKGKNVKEFSDALKESDGTAQKMADTMMKGLPGAIKMLTSSWEYMQIKLVKGGFGNFLEKILNALTELINWFSDLDPLILEFISIIAMAAAAIGPLIVATVALTSAFAFLAANPIILIIAGIVALVMVIIFLVKNWDKVTKKLKESTAFKIAMLPFMPFIKLIQILVAGIKYLITNWDSLIKSFKNSIVFRALYIAFYPFVKSIELLVDAIKFLIENWDALTKTISDSPVFKALKEGFNFLTDLNMPEIGGANVAADKLKNIKNQTDINLKVSTDQPGTTVTTEKIDKKKGDGNVKLQTSGLIGRTVPVGG